MFSLSATRQHGESVCTMVSSLSTLGTGGICWDVLWSLHRLREVLAHPLLCPGWCSKLWLLRVYLPEEGSTVFIPWTEMNHCQVTIDVLCLLLRKEHNFDWENLGFVIYVKVKSWFHIVWIYFLLKTSYIIRELLVIQESTYISLAVAQICNTELVLIWVLGLSLVGHFLLSPRESVLLERETVLEETQRILGTGMMKKRERWWLTASAVANLHWIRPLLESLRPGH